MALYKVSVHSVLSSPLGCQNGTLSSYLNRADLTEMDKLTLVSLFARPVTIIYRFLNSLNKLWKVSNIASRNKLTMEATDVTDCCTVDQFTTTT